MKISRCVTLQEFATETSATSARSKNQKTWRDQVNGMDDDRFAKIARNGKLNTSRPPERPPKH